MNNSDPSPQPTVGKRDYDKLVEKGIRLLREYTMDIYSTERRLRVKAFYLIPAGIRDRRAHANDLAMQAAFDAAGKLDIEIE